jgi:hypothetical protein
MKNSIKYLIVFLILPFMGYAQEGSEEQTEASEKPKEKLERASFESSYLIDNQTDVVLNKKAMEVMFQHRFGLIDDWSDFYGIWGAANIRIGASYGVHERVTLGFGTTKNRRYQDLNWKVALLRQTREDKMPVNLTYYGNFVYDARKQDPTNVPPINYHQDRYSYFHQLILSRRFSPNLSLQFTTSVSHYNTVYGPDLEKNYEGMENDVFGISIGGRYKISPNTAILVDYSQPLVSYDLYNTQSLNPDTGAYEYKSLQPGFSLGFEFGTSGHAFQVFVSNNWGIVNQDNYMWNTNDFFSGDVLIGFNMTRIYNF